MQGRPLNRITLTIVAMALCGVFTAGSSADDSMFSVDTIVADFELLDRQGEVVRYEKFRGKNVLLAFGFTHCLHVCPMIAVTMASALRIAEEDAVGIFVSVDTERDTAVITDDYARGFGEMMIGLGGSHEQVAAAAKNFSATFVVTKSQDNYTVQHTPGIFLIGPDGNVIDVFAMNSVPAKIVAAMK